MGARRDARSTQMRRHTDGCTDGRTDGRTDGTQTDARKNGGTDAHECRAEQMQRRGDLQAPDPGNTDR
eukprot:5007508-Alexandrium_andersonii.AAC.1